MEPNYEQARDASDGATRKEYWETAFGLQAVDDLKPSDYLRRLSEEHVSGEKSYAEVAEELDHYYSEKKIAAEYSLEQEADFVSRAIYEILADGAFSFNIPTLKSYHRRLFSQLPEKVFHAGEFRTVNLTKKEAVLDGDTVQYQDFGLIQESLEYDFSEEEKQNYPEMNEEERVRRIAEFTRRIWQVHPFMEGNTRTTAVFLENLLLGRGNKLDASELHV